MVSSNSYLPLKASVASPNGRSRWTLVIAAGKFLYGLLLVSVGLGVFNLVGKDLAAELLRLIGYWHIDTHLYYVSWLLHKAAHISNGQLILLMQINFIYATLSFIEGFGLAFEKRWANWLVVADTSSFIPIEMYQLYHAFNWINLALLIAYLAIVIYLVARLRQTPPRMVNSQISLPLTPLKVP